MPGKAGLVRLKTEKERPGLRRCRQRPTGRGPLGSWFWSWVPLRGLPGERRSQSVRAAAVELSGVLHRDHFGDLREVFAGGFNLFLDLVLKVAVPFVRNARDTKRRVDVIDVMD